MALSRFGYALHGGNGSIRRKQGGGSRSIAGKVGARASKLFQMLERGHHDVELAPAERRCITLWLDCNANFYGDYLCTKEQSCGEVVMPKTF